MAENFAEEKRRKTYCFQINDLSKTTIKRKHHNNNIFECLREKGYRFLILYSKCFFRKVEIKSFK